MCKIFLVWVIGSRVSMYKFDKTVRSGTVYARRTDTNTPDYERWNAYGGSTCERLGQRLHEHRSDAMCRKGSGEWRSNSNLHKKMRETGVKNWKITPLYTTECDERTI